MAGSRGVEIHEEVRAARLKPDTRRLGQKISDNLKTDDGVKSWLTRTAIILVILSPVPGAIELGLLWLFIFWLVVVKFNPNKKWDFPFRVPAHAKINDGSIPGRKLGEGIGYLGKEISTKLEIWDSNSDQRTHKLVMGTTGSGKTELLLGIVTNALIQNSGFTYIDGKGDPALHKNIFRLCRYYGREDDYLQINFLTSGRDFVDAQVDKVSNSCAPMALGSSGMVTELEVSLMDDSGGGTDMWKGRAIAFITSLNKPLCWLRDRGIILLQPATYIDYFELSAIEKMVFEYKVPLNGSDYEIKDETFKRILKQMEAFIVSLPGYSHDNRYKQESKTLEQWGYVTMQVSRLFNDLTFTYSHIFAENQGEVDLPDVVLQRRILAILLPALERSPDSLKMLGKVIVGQIKQMMAGCLGNRVEGVTREIIDSRPTNAANPYYVCLDEYGFYVVVGFAPQTMDSTVFMFDSNSDQPSVLTSKTIGEIQIGDIIANPTAEGLQPVSVKSVTHLGEMPTYRFTVDTGEDIDSASTHLWPCTIDGEIQQRTTDELRNQHLQGKVVCIGQLQEEGTAWIPITEITYIGSQPVACIEVDSENHLYLTNGGFITHNCAPAQARSLGFSIIFASQDYASLKKASVEEADQTFENTNVRAIGRMVGGTDSETWKRISSLAGEADVEVAVGGREFLRFGEMGDKYRGNKDTKIERRPRLTYDEVAQQENGEFIFLVGKKSAHSDNGVRIIRAKGFYTASETPPDLRINHFIGCEPPDPREIENDRIYANFEGALYGAFLANEIPKVFPDSPSNALSTIEILQGADNSTTWRVSLLMNFLRNQKDTQLASIANSGIVLAKLAIYGAVLNEIEKEELEERNRKAEIERKANEAKAISNHEVAKLNSLLEANTEDANKPKQAVIGGAGGVAGDSTSASGQTLTPAPVEPARTTQNIASTPRAAPIKKAAPPAAIGTGTLADSLHQMLDAWITPNSNKPIHIPTSNEIDLMQPAAPTKAKANDFSELANGPGQRVVSLLTGGNVRFGDDLDPEFLSLDAMEMSEAEQAAAAREMQVRKLTETLITITGEADSIEARSMAQRLTDGLVESTSYITGVTPNPVQIEDMDSMLNALEASIPK